MRHVRQVDIFNQLLLVGNVLAGIHQVLYNPLWAVSLDVVYKQQLMPHINQLYAAAAGDICSSCVQVDAARCGLFSSEAQHLSC